MRCFYGCGDLIGGRDARKEDSRTCAPGETAGEGADNAGGRIRERGNRARARRETRGPLGQAGNCHRAVEGAPGRRQASAPAPQRKELDEAERPHGNPGRTAPIASIAAPFAGDAARAEARAASHGIQTGAVAPCKERHAPPASIGDRMSRPKVGATGISRLAPYDRRLAPCDWTASPEAVHSSVVRADDEPAIRYGGRRRDCGPGIEF